MTDWQRVTQHDFELACNGLRKLVVQLPYLHAGDEGELQFPLVVARRGQGPVVLVVGGTHGDEFEGQIAAIRLIECLATEVISGTIIVVPQHNLPACHAGTRRSPIDGKDLNRIYPASGGDGPSSAIASFVTDRLLPLAEVVIDIHSGGSGMEFVLSSNLQGHRDLAEVRRDLPLLMAFDAPYAIIFDEIRPELAMPHTGTLEAAARAMGKRTLSSELGGGARLSAASATAAERGLRSVLAFLGVLPDAVAVEPENSRSVLVELARPENYITAPAPGLFVPFIARGDKTRNGALIGEIRATGVVGFPSAPVRASIDGIVVAVASVGLVDAGAELFFIADPLPPSRGTSLQDG